MRTRAVLLVALAAAVVLSGHVLLARAQSGPAMRVPAARAAPGPALPTLVLPRRAGGVPTLVLPTRPLVVPTPCRPDDFRSCSRACTYLVAPGGALQSPGAECLRARPRGRTVFVTAR